MNAGMWRGRTVAKSRRFTVSRRRTRRGTEVSPAASPEEAVGYLRSNEIALTYDQATGTLRAAASTAAKTIARKAS
jgi:hypothetical protein